ncbi:MAG: tetratricopeptide repeat protein, partial [Deltaproteobacteria bacterium]|nr:tetratricopeptide repeat protein [Deltaproteobacteria bacterium]
MTGSTLSRHSFYLLIALQIATLALLALGLCSLLRHGERQDAVLRRAEQQASRGAELLAAARFDAARLAYAEAERLAAATGELDRADAFTENARRAEALAMVARPRLPGRAQLDALHTLAERLAGSEQAESRAAGAALEATLLQAQGDLAGAAARARRALQEEKLESPWLRWQLGSALLRQRSTTDAALALEQVVSALPSFAPGFHRLGLAYVAQNRRDAAISALQKSLALGMGAGAALDLARLYLDGQMWAEAIPHLETVLRSRPEEVEALRLLGSALYRLKRFELAAESYSKAYQLKPEPRTLLSAVIALHGGGAHQQALALCETLLPLAPQIPEIRYERALLLIELKQAVEAAAELERYIKL